MPMERRGWVIVVERGPTGSNREEPAGFDGGRQLSFDGTSRMNREVQVRICEGLGVKLPGPTRPTLPTWTVPQVGSCLRYTGRDANVVQTAARDPFETSHDAHLSRFVPGGAYQSTRYALYPFVPSGPDFAAHSRSFRNRPQPAYWIAPSAHPGRKCQDLDHWLETNPEYARWFSGAS